MLEHTYDAWRVVIARRDELGEPVLTPARQVHGAVILSAAQRAGGDTTPADGIVVALGDPLAGVTTADCLPLVVLTPTQALVLHVSRKTVLAGQLEQAPKCINVDKITHAIIGPHICAEHFSFAWQGEEVQAFARQYPEAVRQSEAGLHLSLQSIVEHALATWGVRSDQIVHHASCTVEDEVWPSYRAMVDRGETKDPSVSAGIITAVQGRT